MTGRGRGHTRRLVAVVLGILCTGAAPAAIAPQPTEVVRPLFPLGPRPPATARVGDELRAVLGAYPAHAVFARTHEAPSGDGLLATAGAPRDVPERHLPAGTPAVAWLTWATGETRPVRTEFGQRLGHPFLQLDAPAGIGATRLTMRMRFPPDGPSTRYESTPSTIPPDATLEFGLAILPQAWGQGPVRFSIEACAQTCERLWSREIDPSTETGRGWLDQRVALAELAGRRVRLAFETEHPGAGEPGAFTFPVWSRPAILTPAPPGDRPARILLLSADTLRADHLPSYGYPHDTAPFLDEAIAQQGVLFESCNSSATTTGPAHMTLFTGTLPSVHGIKQGYSTRAAPDRTTLAEVLRDAGYATAAITDGGPLGAHRGFARGFDTYVENQKSERSDVAETFARARAWLDAHGQQPFFLFLHTFQVHAPYDPPPAYAGRFENAADYPDLPPELRRTPALYDGEIRYLDDQLRAFFGDLEARGHLENTLVAFLSDHGEAFGEQGWYGHGAPVGQAVLGVPLLLRGPGLPSGRRIETPVGLADVRPTLLDLVGLVDPQPGSGRSLRPLLQEAGRDWQHRPLFSESWMEKGVAVDARAAVDRAVTPPAFVVRVGDRKLVRRPGPTGPHWAYYDLRADPDERNDRYPTTPEEAADLVGLLEAYARGDASVPDRDVEALDPAVERKLRALGYLD